MRKDDFPTHVAVKREYTSHDLAVIFGVSLNTAKRMVDRGNIPGYRLPISGRLRVPHADLMAYLAREPQYHRMLLKIDWSNARKLGIKPPKLFPRTVDHGETP
jgi:excisionase family DNA binding protein